MCNCKCNQALSWETQTTTSDLNAYDKNGKLVGWISGAPNVVKLHFYAADRTDAGYRKVYIEIFRSREDAKAYLDDMYEEDEF